MIMNPIRPRWAEAMSAVTGVSADTWRRWRAVESATVSWDKGALQYGSTQVLTEGAWTRDPGQAWTALAKAGVIPAKWLSAKLFMRPTNWGRPQSWSIIAPLPTTVFDAVALASDPAGVTAAEELARAVLSCLNPSIDYTAVQVRWALGQTGDAMAALSSLMAHVRTSGSRRVSTATDALGLLAAYAMGAHSSRALVQQCDECFDQWIPAAIRNPLPYYRQLLSLGYVLGPCAASSSAIVLLAPSLSVNLR